MRDIKVGDLLLNRGNGTVERVIAIDDQAATVQVMRDYGRPATWHRRLWRRILRMFGRRAASPRPLNANDPLALIGNCFPEV